MIMWIDDSFWTEWVVGGEVCLRGRTKDMPRETRKKKKTPITSLSRSEPKVLQSIKFTAIVWKHPCEIRVLKKISLNR